MGTSPAGVEPSSWAGLELRKKKLGPRVCKLHGLADARLKLKIAGPAGFADALAAHLAAQPASPAPSPSGAPLDPSCRQHLLGFCLLRFDQLCFRRYTANPPKAAALDDLLEPWSSRDPWLAAGETRPPCGVGSWPLLPLDPLESLSDSQDALAALIAQASANQSSPVAELCTRGERVLRLELDHAASGSDVLQLRAIERRGLDLTWRQRWSCSAPGGFAALANLRLVEAILNGIDATLLEERL